jgi:hypothetical protein
MTWFEREKVVSIDPNLSPIDYLLARMRDPRTEENVKTKIAIALLPFTSPKLAVTYQASESDFAELLDRRIKHMEAIKMIDHQPPTPAEVKPPMSIAERKLRRI